MRIVIILLLCLSQILVAFSANWVVQVGPGGTFTFSPQILHISLYDTVFFNKTSKLAFLLFCSVLLISILQTVEPTTSTTPRTTSSALPIAPSKDLAAVPPDVILLPLSGLRYNCLTKSLLQITKLSSNQTVNFTNNGTFFYKCDQHGIFGKGFPPPCANLFNNTGMNGEHR